jgi:hypothetical protein
MKFWERLICRRRLKSSLFELVERRLEAGKQNYVDYTLIRNVKSQGATV